MDTRRFLLFLVGAALVLMGSPAAAAPPKGDNFANPVNIALNTRKTVKHIEFATLESFSIEDSSCDPGYATKNSVWFRFVTPFNGVYDIDGFGSILRTETYWSTFVDLTLYKLAGSRTEVDCVIGEAPRLVSQYLTAGEYYVRMASRQGDAVLESSRYRLSIRTISMGEMLKDPNFGPSALGIYWKAKKAGNPSQIFQLCDSSCRIRFNGRAKAQLVQEIPFDNAVIRAKAGDIVWAELYINGAPPAGADVKLKIKIVYNDGTPATVVSDTRHLTTGPIASANFGQLVAEFASAKVKKIKFIIISPAASDTFNVIVSQSVYRIGSSVRGVPPAP